MDFFRSLLQSPKDDCFKKQDTVLRSLTVSLPSGNLYHCDFGGNSQRISALACRCQTAMNIDCHSPQIDVEKRHTGTKERALDPG